MRYKRGLSGVVTTTLLILISVIAVIILWAGIKTVIQNSAEDISLKIVDDLKIERMSLIDNINLRVQVSLGTMTSSIDGFRIKINGESGSQTYNYDQKMNMLDIISIDIPTNINKINSVEIYPVMGKSKKVLPKSDTETLISSSYESLVRYYDFEQVNITEIITNTITGLYSSLKIVNKTKGYYGLGEGFVFNDLSAAGRGGLIYNTSLNTISIKIKPVTNINYSSVSTTGTVVFVPLSIGYGSIRLGSSVSGLTNEVITFIAINKTTGSTANQGYTGICNTTLTLSANSWYTITGVWNNSINGAGRGGYMIYLDGVRRDNCYSSNLTMANSAPMGSIVNNQIVLGGDATRSIFSGVLDEVQLYDRSLNAEEIKILSS